MKKVKLSRTLKSYQLIDVVDVLDCMLMSYAQNKPKVLHEDVHAIHLSIAKLLRKDIEKSMRKLRPSN